MTELLIKQLEAATGGSRTLDRDIANAVGVAPLHKLRGQIGASWPDYTASIDSALTLVPEGCAASMEPGLAGVWYANVFRVGPYMTRRLQCHSAAATPALAICIATLKARTKR